MLEPSSEVLLKRQTLVVTFDVGRVGRQVVGEVIGDLADIIFLDEVQAADRADRLSGAEVLFVRNTVTADLRCITHF